jgi:polyisoprenoid-binding protein YceI
MEANSSLHAIGSETTGLEGWFDDESQRGRLELQVGQLKSGNPLYDRELRRRVRARQHPTISGELTSMRPGQSEGLYHAGGEITFRGVTRPVGGDLQIVEADSGRLRITGEQIFDIRDFGMAPPKMLVLEVEPHVSVRIEVFAERDERARS